VYEEAVNPESAKDSGRYLKSLVCSFGYRVETFGSAAEFLQSAQVENTAVYH
jgi:FixJ family two-component response regulator